MPRGTPKQSQAEKIVAALPTPAKYAAIPEHKGVYLTRARTFEARDKGGKTIGTYPSLEEAVGARARWIADRKAGKRLPTVSETKYDFVTFANDVFFVHVYREPKRRPSTIRAARSRFKQYIAPYFSHRKLVDVDYTVLEEFSTYLDGLDRDLSVQSRRECLLLVRLILKAAKLRGLIAHNPALDVELPSRGKPDVDVPPLATAFSIIEKITHPVHHMIANVLLYTGARIGEVVGLQWDDIDETRGIITIRRSVDASSSRNLDGKTENALREVPLMTELIPHLRAYRKLQDAGSVPKNDPWLFPSRRAVRKYADGLPVLSQKSFTEDYFTPARRAVTDHEYTPHSLRHLWATRMLAHHPLVDVSAWLGHSVSTTTLRCYAKYIPSDRPKPQAKMSAAFAAA